jgi:hypothetical protein
MALLPMFLSLGFASFDTPKFEPVAPGPLTRVHHDEMDGVRYAVGQTYKMTFDERGARYLPRFGARAEKNLPLHFAFPTPPLTIARHGDRIVLERESFTEIYDLGIEVVEQSFLLEHRPHDGDFVFRVPVVTELESLDSTGEGLRFGGADLGAVQYGDATIIDAAGNRVNSDSVRGTDSIEITIPDAFLDRAAFPIVIDPLIETIAVDTGSDDMQNPDVVYVDSLNVFIVVYERRQSGSDTDLFQHRYEADGDFLDELVIAGSTADEQLPAIAASGGNVLTAYLNTPDSFFPITRIRARNRIAGSTSVHAAFDVSSLTGVEGRPDIGGTNAATPNPFLITYSNSTTVVAVTKFTIECAIVSTSDVSSVSSLGTLQTQDLNDVLADPSVNQFAKAGGVWLVAYYNEDNPLLSPPEHDIFATAFDPLTGNSVDGVLVSDSLDFIDEVPDVGGDGIDLLVAWQTQTGSQDRDILARRFRYSGGLQSMGNTFNFSDLDHTTPESLDQLEPVVGFDGVRFVVAYREAAVGFQTFDIFASTLFATGTSEFSGTQTVLEKHTTIAQTSTVEFDVAIASTGLDPTALGRHFVAWTQRNSTADDDVRGALFSSLGNGSDAITVQTGCGTPEPALITGTQAVIGADYSILVGNTTNPLLLVGFQTSVPLCPGQAGCTLGVSPISMFPVPLLLTTTIPGDPALLGAPFALQVVDLLPSNATGTLCGPPKYTQKFRVSDTRVTTIR